jgi:hypothetical protein
MKRKINGSARELKKKVKENKAKSTGELET